jgi:hypothetical protein
VVECPQQHKRHNTTRAAVRAASLHCPTTICSLFRFGGVDPVPLRTPNPVKRQWPLEAPKPLSQFM